MPSVMRKAEARASPSPIQPTTAHQLQARDIYDGRWINILFHSQSLRLQNTSLVVDFRAVAPGTKIKHTRKMMMPGAMRSMIVPSHVGTVSGSLCGKEMSKSMGENGRLYGGS